VSSTAAMDSGALKLKREPEKETVRADQGAKSGVKPPHKVLSPWLNDTLGSDLGQKRGTRGSGNYIPVNYLHGEKKKYKLYRVEG